MVVVIFPSKSGDRLEGLAAVLFDVEKIGRRKQVLIVFVRRITAHHPDHLVRLLHARQGVQQNCIDHAEDRRVGADAES